MKNITYYLGAGASYNACPILNELSDCMIKMANHIFNFFEGNTNEDYTPIFKIGKNALKKELGLAFEIGAIGVKAKEFNTIDTYARKLVLNRDYNSLNKLKQSLSSFFVLWPKFISEKKTLSRELNHVDQRYISLLATLLYDENRLNPVLPSNINIITWNYDFQLELAYKTFCEESRSWTQINETFKFQHNPLQSCHLNGISGFCENKEKELINLIQRTDTLDFIKSVSTLSDIFDDHYPKDFNNYVRFAWESEDLESEVMKRAIDILELTDELIVIGYSFPSFNRIVDSRLLSFLNPNINRVIYNDPNASEEVLLKALPVPYRDKIKIHKDASFFDVF
jgi:hypothetical protein